MATGTVYGELLGDLSEKLRVQMADSPVGLFMLYQALELPAAPRRWAMGAAQRRTG